jgi:SAM-dependent methyltransferase
MALRDFIKPRLQDWMMGFMDEMRPATVVQAEGEVLEVGFGTGRNLRLYPSAVKSVTGLDPMVTEGVPAVDERVAQARVTTWTLCSIPDAAAALREMRRVLKPRGRYLFIEHGKSERESTARWQDRLNPIWSRISDGCNINRPIDRIVADAGFELTSIDRFRGKGPGLFAQMYRGVAERS